jgi:uncharacterized protein YlzI (FlbEa/FlbD family)
MGRLSLAQIHADIHHPLMTESISFAEFTLDHGNPVLVNVAEVVSVEPSDDQTRISLTNGKCVTVRQGFDAASEVMGSDGPTGC